MSTQHCTICLRQFRATSHTDNDDPVGEDRRLLRLLGQRMYAAKPDKQHAQHQEQKDPTTPTTKRAPFGRLIRYAATDGVTPWGMSDAGCMWSGRDFRRH
jgi:hypothetical protein